MKQITIVNLISNRICLKCGSNKTLLKAGRYERWYKTAGGFLCHYCYRLENEDFKKYRNNEKYNKNKLAFKDRRILLSYNPRTDICSKCGKYNKKTQMHHAIGYYIIFPWYGTIELCPSCHVMEKDPIDISNRICLLCKSNTTHIDKKGLSRWYKYDIGFICNNCYCINYKLKKSGNY